MCSLEHHLYDYFGLHEVGGKIFSLPPGSTTAILGNSWNTGVQNTGDQIMTGNDHWGMKNISCEHFMISPGTAFEASPDCGSGRNHPRRAHRLQSWEDEIKIPGGQFS